MLVRTKNLQKHILNAKYLKKQSRGKDGPPTYYVFNDVKNLKASLQMTNTFCDTVASKAKLATLD
jgi:hypothetical protein